jgi:hypothetical protein
MTWYQEATQRIETRLFTLGGLFQHFSQAETNNPFSTVAHIILVLLFDIFVFQVLLEKIMKHVYDYVIVGGGLTEAAAVEGTREFDVTESVLLIWEENHMLF